jgi:hypothetical protein
VRQQKEKERAEKRARLAAAQQFLATVRAAEDPY